MPVIDLHTHAFPDALAARAVARLKEINPVEMFGGATVGALLESMDRAGIDASVICAIATKSGQADGILKWCDAIRSNRIVPFPSVHPEAPDVEKCLERIVAEGFSGIKLHAFYQDFVVDDEAVRPLYAAAEALELVIQFHAGRDFGFPMDDDRAAPERLARVADRFGRLRMICAHVGGWRMWDEADEHLLGRANVHFETSYSLGDLGGRRAADMIRRHGADRVMFGTDWPWADQAESLALLNALPLDEPTLARIHWDNAAELLHLP